MSYTCNVLTRMSLRDGGRKGTRTEYVGFSCPLRGNLRKILLRQHGVLYVVNERLDRWARVAGASTRPAACGIWKPVNQMHASGNRRIGPLICWWEELNLFTYFLIHYLTPRIEPF
jgi:hypothetical protein